MQDEGDQDEEAQEPKSSAKPPAQPLEALEKLHMARVRWPLQLGSKHMYCWVCNMRQRRAAAMTTATSTADGMRLHSHSTAGSRV